MTQVDGKLQKLTAARQKAEAKLRELKRRELDRAAKLSGDARKADTRRKVLAGSWLLDEAEKDAGLRERMTRALERFWLVRDDDRRLFGFDVLTEEQKAAHPNADSLRRGGRKAGPSPAPFDSSGSGPASDAA